MTQYTQDQLYQLSCKITEKFDIINELFGLGLTQGKKQWYGCCPIHKGDNTTAFNLYFGGTFGGGNWACRSNNCEKYFQNGISSLSFIRALLSVQNGWKSSRDKDKIVSFPKTLKFCEDFLGEKLSSETVDKIKLEKQRFVSLFKQKENIGGETDKPKLTRDIVRQNLLIPSPYFLSRGFSEQILDKYDIGDCTKPGKTFNGRAVIPIYDDSNTYMVGGTGRSIYDRCDSCGSYHNHQVECPSEDFRGIYSKWKNNFEKSNYLFNLWWAKNRIKESGCIILVEGPANVLRLEECCIQNSVAIFGTQLSEVQRFLINLSGCTTVLTIFDNDDAGQSAVKTIQQKLCKLYHLINYIPKMNDIAEMKVDIVKEELCPILEKVG